MRFSGGKDPLTRRLILWPEIPRQERCTNVALPATGAKLTCRQIRCLLDRHRQRRGGVAEASEHAGDVAKWRHLLTTFLERARWLPLEVDHHEFAAGRVQHLTQVIITVRSRSRAEV